MADGKAEGGKQISEATDAPAYRRGRQETDPAGRHRRNLRFRIHADLFRQQAHHRQNGRPDHPGIAAAWGLLKHHFAVVKQTGNAATFAELDATLRQIRVVIEALSEMR